VLRFVAERLHDATENVTGIAQFVIFARDEHDENAEVVTATAASGIICALCVPDPALPAVTTLPPLVAETWKLFVVKPVDET
jgi:hypothetical protein